MNIIQEIKKSVYAKYQTSTLWTVDQIPFYLNHSGPICYTIIVFDHISSRNTMAMPTISQPTGFDYVDSRFQFTILSNDHQHVELEDITDRLENVFHRTPLTLSNGCTHIGSICINSRTDFFDKGLKVWKITTDFRILAGK